MEGITICKDAFNEKIFIPKPIRRFPHYEKRNKKGKTSKYNNVFYIEDNSLLNKNKYNLEDISFEEIEKDFKALDLKREELECFDEINNIFLNNIGDFTFNSKNKKIKRNKNSKKILKRI